MTILIGRKRSARRAIGGVFGRGVEARGVLPVITSLIDGIRAYGL